MDDRKEELSTYLIMSKKQHKLRLRFDRALSYSLTKQIAILVGILLVTLALSFLFLEFSGGDWRSFCQIHKISPWLLPIFLLIDTNSFNRLYMDSDLNGWMIFACCISYMVGFIVFNGMLVGVITNAIGNRVNNYRNGLTHYLKSGHYVIMGYDEMVPSVIEDIFDKDNNAYVLLLTSFDAKKIKERLKKSVAKKQIGQIIVNYGQKTAMDYYDEIHIENAQEIYIVGNRTRPDHDATNVECVDSICSYLKAHPSAQKPKRITCVFEDIDTYAAFKTSEIFGEVRELGIEFIPYNFYTGWAQQVFLSRSYKEKSNPTFEIPYPAVYGNGIGPDDSRFVHLVFAGTTNLAVSFAMEAAHVLHFPNFDESTKQPKTLITFIERNADKEKDLFKTRNRHLFEILDQKDNILDVEFEFINGDIFSDEVQDMVRNWACDKDHQYLSIFLTMADQRNNFIMGMNMPDEVYDNAIPVFIRQDRADNFVTNLRKADNNEFTYSQVKNGSLERQTRKGRHANLYPFGMNDMAYCSNEVSYKRAKLINYLYHTADYDNSRFTEPTVLAAMPSDTLWADADKYWQELSVALKWSNLYCAYSIPGKLASLRVMRGLQPDDTSHDQQPLTPEEITTMAHVEHNRWNIEKLLMGYRKAKEEEDLYQHPEFAKDLKKNKDLYIHHDIRPYDELPEPTKLLDMEIVRFIPWIIKMTE